MRKFVAVILSVFMLGSVIMMTSCSSKSEVKDEPSEETSVSEEESEETESSPAISDTEGGRLFGEFVSRVSENSDLNEVASEISEESISGYSCISAEVSEGFLNGFDEEISGFNSGVVFAPVVGTIPYIVYMFESDNPEALKDNLLSHADPRWNICTEADEVFCDTYENYVFFAMLPES